MKKKIFLFLIVLIIVVCSFSAFVTAEGAFSATIIFNTEEIAIGTSVKATVSNLTPNCGALSFNWYRVKNGNAVLVSKSTTSNFYTTTKEDLGFTLRLVVKSAKFDNVVTKDSVDIIKYPAPEVKVDDVSDKFSISLSSMLEYHEIKNYQYQIASGEWQNYGSAPSVSVGNVNLAVGAVKVRLNPKQTDKTTGASITIDERLLLVKTNKTAFKTKLESTVKIDGVATIHQTLTATVENISEQNPTIKYQWYRNNKDYPIKDATNATYTLQTADYNCIIFVKISADEYSGEVQSEHSDVVKKLVQTEKPSDISIDEATNSFNFVLNQKYPTPASYEYCTDNGQKWQAVTQLPMVLGDVAIPSGYLQVRVKSTLEFYAGDIIKSEVAMRKNFDVKYEVVGENKLGSMLTVILDKESDTKISYQWKRDGEDIAGANSNVYTITNEDVNHKITVVLSSETQDGTSVSKEIILSQQKSSLPQICGGIAGGLALFVAVIFVALFIKKKKKI
ncbi:MAG: hypothetical protein RRY78_04885 [Clostridia bacterium]